MKRIVDRYGPDVIARMELALSRQGITSEEALEAAREVSKYPSRRKILLSMGDSYVTRYALADMCWEAGRYMEANALDRGNMMAFKPKPGRTGSASASSSDALKQLDWAGFIKTCPVRKGTGADIPGIKKMCVITMWGLAAYLQLIKP